MRRPHGSGHPRGVLAAFVLEDPDSVPTRTPGAADTPGPEAPLQGSRLLFRAGGATSRRRPGPRSAPAHSAPHHLKRILEGLHYVPGFLLCSCQRALPALLSTGFLQGRAEKDQLISATAEWLYDGSRGILVAAAEPPLFGPLTRRGPLAAWASAQEGVLAHLLNQRILRVPLHRMRCVVLFSPSYR